jgi:hypothetical protein
MTSDDKFMPLINDLKRALQVQADEAAAAKVRADDVHDTFRPTANYLIEFMQALQRNVDDSIAIRWIDGWQPESDQKFKCRYEVSLRGSVRKMLIFTVRGKKIEFDNQTFTTDDQAALEDALGKSIVKGLTPK